MGLFLDLNTIVSKEVDDFLKGFGFNYIDSLGHKTPPILPLQVGLTKYYLIGENMILNLYIGNKHLYYNISVKQDLKITLKEKKIDFPENYKKVEVFERFLDETFESLIYYLA